MSKRHSDTASLQQHLHPGNQGETETGGWGLRHDGKITTQRGGHTERLTWLDELLSTAQKEGKHPRPERVRGDKGRERGR